MTEPLFFGNLSDNGGHFLDAYDEYFGLSLSSAEFKQISAKIASEKATPEAKLTELLKKCFSLFSKGLDDRYEQIGYHFLDSKAGKLKVAEKIKKNEKIEVLIGFKVTKQWSNPLTVGPVANESEAKDFRAFWHGASVLRRFADSRVCECMVWAEQPSPAVVKTILQFLLKKFFNLPEATLTWKSSFYVPTASKNAGDGINQAFSTLSTTLRSLKNLPLSVTNIHGVSPFLRGTEPQPELTKGVAGPKLQDEHYLPCSAFPKLTPSVEVFIKMAYSTKWGNDVKAINKLTAAFYLQIAEQLKTVHKLIAVPTEECIYVVQDSIVFCLIIVNDKVHKLLDEQVTSLKQNGAARIESTPEGRALASFQKRFVTELQLCSSLHSFSLKNGFFSSTVQLMKLWLGAHQMSNIISDLALELIVAAALKCKDGSEPGSSLCAFRRCLKLLVQHNWISQPLFVDFDAAWTQEDRDKLELSFIKMRPVLPPMVILTNEDTVGTKWTRDGPTPTMLKRIIGLATNSLQIIDQGLVKGSNVDLLGSVTQTSYKHYDLVITVHPNTVCRSKNGDQEEIKGLPVVDYDPLSDLVEAAQNAYGSVALFFYNKYGGDKIAAKFKPTEEEVPAKISRCSHHISKGRERLVLNREEIVENLQILGKSLIKSIEKNY